MLLGLEGGVLAALGVKDTDAPSEGERLRLPMGYGPAKLQAPPSTLSGTAAGLYGPIGAL